MADLDHISIHVPASDTVKVIDSYKAVLEAVGLTEMFRYGGPDAKEYPGPLVVGMGDAPNHKAFLWFQESEGSSAPIHVGISVKDRALVDAFHASALKQGWKCNGPPGPRPLYGPTYYGGFALDPMGNNIELVCREAQA